VAHCQIYLKKGKENLHFAVQSPCFLGTCNISKNKKKYKKLKNFKNVEIWIFISTSPANVDFNERNSNFFKRWRHERLNWFIDYSWVMCYWPNSLLGHCTVYDSSSMSNLSLTIRYLSRWHNKCINQTNKSRIRRS